MQVHILKIQLKSNILFGRFDKKYVNIKNRVSPWHHIFPNIN